MSYLSEINPSLAIGLMLTALGILFALANATKFSSELSRKIVHVGMGIICLTFPWIFRELWPVIVLAAVAVASLLLVKCVPGLRNSVGSCLHDVKRQSLGDIYFTIAIALLFWLSDGDKIFFCVPLLILTIADATGALIGIRYGKTPFATLSGDKSAEGSTTFFLTAFLSAHIPLLLFTETGRAETLVISITLALMVMLVEAISTRGIDNLLIPLGSFYLLSEYLEMDSRTLIGRLILLSLLLATVLFLRKKSSLDGSSLLGAVLFGYAAFALGGGPCLIALFVMFLSHIKATGDVEKVVSYEHNLRSVICVALTGMLWLIFSPDDLKAPFFMGISAHFAILNLNSLSALIPDSSLTRRLLQSSLKACSLTYLPIILFYPKLWIHLLVAVVLTIAGSVVFSKLFPATPKVSTSISRWIAQAIIATIISLAALFLP